MRTNGIGRTALWILLLSCAALAGCDGKQKDRVRDSWDRYIAAATSNDGPTMVSLLNQKTLDFYERVRLAALESGAEEIKQLPLMEKMIVLLTRVHVQPSYLRQLTGGQL